MEWVLQQAKAKQAVISGFHSPLEQSVLHVLLQARSPVVMVLARPVACAKLRPDWLSAIVGGHMAVVSTCTTTRRLTGKLAVQRNEVVAKLATRIVIGYASPIGSLMDQSRSWMENHTIRFL